MEWIMYCDESYYSLWCVRPKNNNDFNTPLSFHFISKEDAEEFLTAVKKAYY